MSVLGGVKEDDIHDALHKGAGNKTPYVVTSPGVVQACAFDPLPDGRRYAACGDGVVAPVATWIGTRLLAAMTAPPSAEIDDMLDGEAA